MKQKLLLTLFALFCVMGGAMAQKPTASSAPVDGKWAADTHWYFIQFANSDQYHVGSYLCTEGENYIAADGKLLLNGGKDNKPVKYAALWCFVGDDTNGYTIYNRKCGTQKRLSMTTAEAKMLAEGAQGYTQLYDYAPSGSPKIANAATFKLHGTTNSYLNNQDGANNPDYLKVWKDNAGLNDNGSAMVITEVTADELAQMTMDCTLTDADGTQYVGTFHGTEGETPTFQGVEGYQLSGETWDGTSYSATITFPFPVNTATGIQSEIASGSKWFADANDKILASQASTTKIYTSKIDFHNWIIIPSINDGVFSFKLKNVGADKFIPANMKGYGNTNYLTDEDNAGSFYFCQLLTGKYGFATDLTSNDFLTVYATGTNQSIVSWHFNGTATHTGSNMSFPEITADVDDITINADFAALAGLEKFTLVDGAIVISPSEYAAPTEINAAIDAYNAVDATNVEAKDAFLKSTNGAKLKTFKNASDTWGAPLQFTWSIKAEKWGTMFSPVNFARPNDLEFYSCLAEIDGLLTLSTPSGYGKNVPFLIKNTTNEDKTYQIIGYAKGAPTANKTEGLLTGVIVPETKVPVGSFILATQNNVQAFYRVDTINFTIGVNKCYITMPEGTQARVLMIDESGVITGIESLEQDSKNDVIFNMAGQRVNTLQKGINIVNGKKILVK